MVIVITKEHSSYCGLQGYGTICKTSSLKHNPLTSSTNPFIETTLSICIKQEVLYNWTLPCGVEASLLPSDTSHHPFCSVQSCSVVQQVVTNVSEKHTVSSLCPEDGGSMFLQSVSTHLQTTQYHNIEEHNTNFHCSSTLASEDLTIIQQLTKCT